MSGNVNDSVSSTSYMPLNVGDVRQLIWKNDSTTILYTVTGKTSREDGTSVYSMKIKMGTTIGHTNYYFLKDGYYVGTELDSTYRTDLDLKINPFNEQRLAKLDPNDGEIFIHTLGDSDTSYWKISKENSITTFCGVFEDVYSFLLFDNLRSSPILRTYYAKGIGYIATAISNSTMPDFSVSYVKIGNTVMGSLWPEKDYGGGFDKYNLSEINKFISFGFLTSLPKNFDTLE